MTSPQPTTGTSLPINVLQVSAFYAGHGGGIEIVADRIARNLAADRIHVTWAAGLDAGRSLPEPSEGLEFSPARYWDLLESRLGLPCPIWSASAITRLWTQVGRADLVHLHDALYLPCILAMLFSKLRRKPVVLTQHIGDLPLRSRMLHAVLRFLNRTLVGGMLGAADQVVFIADQVMAYFGEFARYRRPPLLIPNGVDHDVYRPDPLRPSSPVARLLFVGRFVEKKGVQHLRGCVDLSGTIWTFIGKGPLSPSNWSALPENVTVIEGLPPEAIVPHYQQADLLVLPSHGEGFPLVVQEALACGTPVLVGREVAHSCPRRDSGCVFDVDVSSTEAGTHVRDALLALIRDMPRLRAARANAARLARQWSWEACAAAYLDVFEAILPGRQRP